MGNPSEFRTYDSRGDSYVQAFRRGASEGVIGDVKAVADKVCHFRADTVAFVAHDDDACRDERSHI